MGMVTCGIHPRNRCCWRCDRCPRCEPETGRLLRGDYCRSCTEKFKAEGCTWDSYSRTYIRTKPLERVGPIVTGKPGQGSMA